MYIEKIRPIDKQLAYQVDKLLRTTAKAQAAADTDAAAAAAGAGATQAAATAAGGDDALQYQPNPKALISKVPLVGGTAGACASAADSSAPAQRGQCRWSPRVLRARVLPHA